MSANGVPALLDTTITEPAAAVARAMASSPSGCTVRCSVVGAIPHGTQARRPSSVTDGSTSVTSFRTCGWNRTERQASVASAAVTDSRAPWTR